MNIDLRLGDCIDVLKTIPDNSVDSIVTDPPYGIGFMNKEWDNPQKHQELIEREKKRSEERFADGKSPAKAGFSTGVQPGLPIGGAKEGKWFQDWCELWATECYRVLKPGGHALSFAAPRTYHRMATAFEDVGFQIRDQIMWVFGSGFPKSHNIGKKNQEWEGWGTALKPAHEPIVMARKPLSEKSIAENVLKHGTGGINIDGSRIEFEDTPNAATNPKYRKEGNYKMPEKGQESNGAVKFTSSKNEYDTSGRFPANIIFDEQAGEQLGEYSRFFYCPKTSKKDRNDGLDGFESKALRETSGGTRDYNARCAICAKKFIGPPERICNCEEPITDNQVFKQKNSHPTVKPTDLMRYLINLVTPQGGTTLDPFMGSGSTGKAAVRCGVNFIGIEKEQEYMDIARARIEHEKNKPVQTKLL